MYVTELAEAHKVLLTVVIVPPPPPPHHHYGIIDPSLINNVDVLKWLKYSEFYIDSLFNITVL